MHRERAVEGRKGEVGEDVVHRGDGLLEPLHGRHGVALIRR